MTASAPTSDSKPHGIVVAVDGSPASRVATDWAARDAALRGVQLTVFHVQPSDEMGPWLDVPVLDFSAEVERRSQRIIDDAMGLVSDAARDVGDIEVTLARIWAETLQLDRVGRHDNFFRLGGHSLLAIRLIERMRSEGLQIDVRTLFITPTIAGLAEGMEEMKEIIL